MKTRALVLTSLYFAQVVVTLPHNIEHSFNNYGNIPTADQLKAYHKLADSSTYGIAANNGLNITPSNVNHNSKANAALNRFILQNQDLNNINGLSNHWTGNSALTTNTFAQNGLSNHWTGSSAMTSNTVAQNGLSNHWTGSGASTTNTVPQSGLSNHLTAVSSVMTNTGAQSGFLNNWTGSSALTTNAVAQNIPESIASFNNIGYTNNFDSGIVPDNKVDIALDEIEEIKEETHEIANIPEESEFIGYVTFEGYLPVEGTVSVANGVCELCSQADSSSNA